MLFDCPNTKNLTIEVLGAARVNYSNAGAYVNEFSRTTGDMPGGEVIGRLCNSMGVCMDGYECDDW